MLASLTQREFAARHWDHQPGESVFFCEPSQGGKTEWAFKLLAATDHVKPPVALVMKPIDPTPARWTKRLRYKEVQAWPPPKTAPWASKPPGYTLWPKHELSLDPASITRTNAKLKAQFERALMDAYRRGHRTVFCDEIYGLLAELHMNETINALLTRGMGMGAGLWYATQKPGGTTGSPMPGFVFNNWVHAFFGKDPVARNRKTFTDMTGVDNRFLTETMAGLQVYPTSTPEGIKPVSEKLYVNKNGPRGGYMCIVRPY
jgi:hypothetical protein